MRQSIPKITNDLDRMLAILRFRKLRPEEVLSLLEEIEQLRRENAEAAIIVAELLPKELETPGAEEPAQP